MSGTNIQFRSQKLNYRNQTRNWCSGRGLDQGGIFRTRRWCNQTAPMLQGGQRKWRKSENGELKRNITQINEERKARRNTVNKEKELKNVKGKKNKQMKWGKKEKSKQELKIHEKGKKTEWMGIRSKGRKAEVNKEKNNKEKTWGKEWERTRTKQNVTQGRNYTAINVTRVPEAEVQCYFRRLVRRPGNALFTVRVVSRSRAAGCLSAGARKRRVTLRHFWAELSSTVTHTGRCKFHDLNSVLYEASSSLLHARRDGGQEYLGARLQNVWGETRLASKKPDLALQSPQ